jgi:hypothetical protein
LATAVAIRQPENLEDFIVEQLAIKKEQGLRSGIFTESEVQNVFNLFDLKKEGHISKERCTKGNISINWAIQTMASSSFQFTNAELQEIPEKVDSFQFKNICEKVLGLSKKEI